MKKTLSLIVSLLLALSLLAPAAPATEEKALEDYEDVLTITGYFMTSPVYGNENLQHEWLKENLKLDIQGAFSTGDSPANKLSLMVASNEMPDVVFADASYRTILQEFVNSGMVAAANDYFDVMPNFLKYRNEDIIDYWSDADDGRLYMLPGFVLPPEYAGELGIGDPTVMGIRQDVLDATGMEMPETIDQFYELLKKSKEVFADKGGVYEGFVPFGMMYAEEFDNTNGMGSNANMLAYSFGLPGGGLVIDEENGYVLDAFMTEPWQEAHRFLAKLFREGLLDPEMITGDTNTLREKGKQGKYGVLFTSISDFGDHIEGAIDRLGIEADYVCMELPHIDGIEKTNWLYKNALGSTIGLVSKDAPDVQRIMKYVDWQNTVNGNMVTWWGGPSEEESWFYFNENGEAVRNGAVFDKILEGEMDTSYISPWTYWIAGLGVTIPSDINASIIASPGVRPFHQASKDIGFKQYYNDPKLDPYLLTPKGEEYDACWTDISAVVNKYRAELIMRTADDEEFDRQLQNMYDELERAGIYRVAAENYELYKQVNNL